LANELENPQREMAKAMYMKYEPLSIIEASTGITVSNLKNYSRKWKIERDAIRSEIIHALTESKRALMFSISKNGLEVLAKAMEDLRKGTRQLSPKEMSGIANIINDLDKIVKLDDGNPTDIIAEIKPSSTIEIRKLMAADPFGEIEDAIITKELSSAGIKSDGNSGSGE
jgi:hypothetical protein